MRAQLPSTVLTSSVIGVESSPFRRSVQMIFIIFRASAFYCRLILLFYYYRKFIKLKGKSIILANLKESKLT